MPLNRRKKYLKSPYDRSQGYSLIQLAKGALAWTLCIAVLLELVFFPELENLLGAAMALVCLWIFNTFFLKRTIILRHPFAFLMFLSMFLYRYIPLIATFIEGKPISYGFENPYQTFLFETALFAVSSLSFYFACVYRFAPKNSSIQKALYRAGFFHTDNTVLWIMGVSGVVVHLYGYSTGGADYGDVGGKFVAGIKYFIYAPLILLFPKISRTATLHYNKNLVWAYFVFVVVLSLASNSRQALIAPIGTIMLLYLLDMIKTNRSVSQSISLPKLIPASLALLVVLNFISDISLAMLANRNIRSDVSRAQLFEKTWQTWQDEEQMQKIKAAAHLTEQEESLTYWDGWTESYINNFMLNRYGNMRISDQTLYYAGRLGWSNPQMQDNLMSKTIATYPTNILAMVGVNIDKNDLEYSQGDYLYSLATGNSGALGSYRVTSHIGDGLATWGIWYFPIQFILFFIVFKLLDCLVLYGKRTTIYSPYGLMSIFFFLAMFRNANGALSEIGYILRGFWQDCFTYLLVLLLITLVLNRRIV